MEYIYQFNKSCKTFQIVGGTGTGKSFLLASLLLEHEKMFELKIESILYCYKTFQDKFYELEAKLGEKIKFNEGLPSRELLSSVKTPCIVALDDLYQECYNSAVIEQLYTVDNHHSNLIPIILTQNCYYQGTKSRTINLNTQVIILTKCLRDIYQIRTLARSMFNEHYKTVLEAYKDCEKESKNNYFYLVLDASQGCDRRHKVRSSILSSDGCPVIYLPKSGEPM